MKNVLLIINVLLVIAVATLFFLYFSKKAPSISTSMTNTAASSEAPSNFRIAYFEMDSIENNYNYFKDVRNKFRSREEKLNTDLQQLKDQYTRLWDETNQSLAKLSDQEKMKRQQMLQGLEEKFKNMQSIEGSALQNDGFKDRQEVYKKIQNYLKQYNKEKGFAFVFASNPDLIYYKDTIYNITSDLVKGLNKEYISPK